MHICANRQLWNFFSILLQNGRSCVHKLCPSNFQKKFKFRPNSKTNVVPPCLLKRLKSTFLCLKNAEIHIKIDLQMATISLFEWLNRWCGKFNILSVKKNKKSKIFLLTTPAAAYLHQSLHENRGCLCHFCMPLIFFNQTSSFGASRLHNFGENAQLRF